MLSCSVSDFLQRTDAHEQYIARVVGVCERGYGPGSWAALIVQGELKTELSGSSAATTQSRMELFAAMEALSALPEDASLTVNSTSTYLVKGMNTWIKKWKSNDWRKENGTLKNVDLWQKLDELASKRAVKWVYVRGEDAGDELLGLARREQPAAAASAVGERAEFTLVSASEFLERLQPTDAVTVFTDGACKCNPGPGGWGAVLQANGLETELSGGEFYTTNNRMELTAAIKALELLPAGATVSLSTDSNYVRDGLKKWVRNWKKNDWKTNNGNPVKNQELWEILDELVSKCNVDIQWVKGHVGNPLNERADRLAVGATPLKP